MGNSQAGGSRSAGAASAGSTSGGSSFRQAPSLLTLRRQLLPAAAVAATATIHPKIRRTCIRASRGSSVITCPSTSGPRGVPDLEGGDTTTAVAVLEEEMHTATLPAHVPELLQRLLAEAATPQDWLPVAVQRFSSALLAIGMSLSISLTAGPGWTVADPASMLETSEHRWRREADLASQGEDKLLEVVKQIEAWTDGVVQEAADLLPAAQGSSAESAELARELVKEVWEVVDQNFLDARDAGFDRDRWQQLRDDALARPLRNQAAAHSAIRDMLARGLSDPYTRFISPQDFEGMKKYDVTGVGLNLGSREEFVRKVRRDATRGRNEKDEGVWVLGLLKDSQAEVAGIEQGDEILAVDDARVANLTPFQVSSSIQGDERSASTVKITFAKAGNRALVHTVSVPRTKQGSSAATANPVTSELRKEGDASVGYVRVASFTARAQAEVASSLQNLASRGAEEIVLDLRDNRGGLVTSGVEVARLFLDKGATVVVTKGPPTRPDDRITAPGPPLTTMPLTVLVNEHTASASEILAGALKDNCRAVLVGSQTYGKGLIQSVYELSDSSGIVITVGKYVTPGGFDIDRNGIKPSFPRKPSRQAHDESLKACRVDSLASA